MKEIIKFIIQTIALLAIAKLCVLCGEITGDGFSYGVLWCIIVELTFRTKIIVTNTDKNGNETRKRIY